MNRRWTLGCMVGVLSLLAVPALAQEDASVDAGHDAAVAEDAATTPDAWNLRVGPTRVHSSPAADGWFPAMRFAIRNASSSMGPEGGTPTSQ